MKILYNNTTGCYFIKPSRTPPPAPAPAPAPPAPAPAPAPPPPPPVPVPVTHRKGTLNQLAADTWKNTSTFLSSESDVLTGNRSIGYFGIGFGGNTKSHGAKSQNYSLADIDLSTYTHINIAFLAVNKAGNLTIPNSFSDRGSSSSSNLPNWLNNINTSYQKSFPTDKAMENFEYVKAIFKNIHSQVTNNKSNKSVRIMPTIGGWNIANNTGIGTEGYGDNLHILAKEIEKGLTTPMYKSFKKDLQFLHNKGWVSGVDIDWEYPGRPPIASRCIDNNGNERACKVSEPTQIGPCAKGSKACVSFAYNDNELVDDSKWSMCKSATYRLPISIPDNKALKTKGYSEPTYYSAFIKAIKDDVKASEVSIALAGAPWGLHWYANTATTLLKSGHIDFANIMAYDYNGFWGSGQISGFLSNKTNMNVLDICNSNSNSLNSPHYWDTCIKSAKTTFNNNNNNILTIKTPPRECPLIFYNVLKDIVTSKGVPLADVTKAQVSIMTKSGSSSDQVWFDDHNNHSSGIVQSQDSSRLTLSTDTIINMLTNVFKIDPKQLVLGLPYYGRTFQSKAFDDNSYGLHQPYSYGSAYSYSDIHENYYKGSKSHVYTIKLGNHNSYTEDIVYATGNNMLSRITPEMNAEMISYNSQASIKDKVISAKQLNLGGYMAWHMLSDYYE
jgi:GH18 family chitinase